MKGEHYPLESTPDKEFFFFQSIGPKGVFQKAIWFDKLPEGVNLFNLALCVVANGRLEDDIVTNNEDFVKTMYTVAKAVQEFFGTNPDAVLQISALGAKRLRIYTEIFQRKYDELGPVFLIKGIIEGQSEKFQPDRFYQAFEIALKKK